MKILKTDLEIYPIGQGTLFGRSMEGESSNRLIKKKIDILKYGVDIGMNFIDTGEDYEGGKSEKLLAEVLKGQRDKIVVGSKFMPANNSYKNVMISLEKSLERMKTDYIDIYQIQWPNPKIPIDETLSAFNKLIEQGKIRYFGVGNFSLKQIKEALSFDELNKLCVLQTEYDLFNRQIEKEILPFNKANRITTIAYMSFGKNLFNEEESAVLEKLRKKYNRSSRSIVLNWILSHSDVALLTSSMSKKNTLENYESLNFNLDDSDITEINKVFNRGSVLVDPSEIEVLDFDESDTAHKIYTTIEEAKKNDLGIKPSALEIAEEIKLTGTLLRPVELKLNTSQVSNKKYVLVRGRMRFWGWLIAFGDQKKIECKIF